MRKIFITTIFLLILFLSFPSCSPQQVLPDTSSPSDTPKYTADQVISVAKARFPLAYSSNKPPTQSVISTFYSGNSIWSVHITAPRGFHLKNPLAISVFCHFNEITNSLTISSYQ